MFKSGLRGLAGGGLVGGAEVTDRAGGFFGGAGGVEGDEAGEDFGVVQVGFGVAVAEPAVGGGDGGIEFVVKLAEDGEESGVVGGLFLRGECGGGKRAVTSAGGASRHGIDGAMPSSAQFFEDVIHRGERKAGVLRLHPLAVRVQFLGTPSTWCRNRPILPTASARFGS
jgi:hypothetical protein